MSSHHRRCFSCDQRNNPQKDITFKSKSKNVLDIRMVPGHPQGAWVECYDNTFDEDAQVGIAEENAERIHHQYEQRRKEREEKLMSFQSEVSQRVRLLENLKQLQLRTKSIKNEEEEQNAILQRTLGLRIPYKGKIEDLQALNKELLKSCIVPCEVDRQMIRTHVEESNELLSDMCNQVSEESNDARRNLLAKRLSSFPENETLPGGTWRPKSPKTASSTIAPKKPPVFNTPLVDTWTGPHQIKPHQLEANETALNDQTTIDTGNGNKPQHAEDAVEEVCGNTQEEEGEDEEPALMDPLFLRSAEELGINNLHRNLILDWCEKRHNETEDGKKQIKHQYWNYRKIFMEIEREQVQKYRHNEEHKKRILRLKIQREKERENEEKMSEFPERTIVSLPKELPKHVSPQKVTVSKNMQQVQDEKELYRYIDALREVAKERVRVSSRTLPPLCPCGPTIWDSHPEKCANNCLFYKNPKAYVRVLTTILANNR